VIGRQLNCFFCSTNHSTVHRFRFVFVSSQRLCHLVIKCDEPLSSVGFNFTLRCYNTVLRCHTSAHQLEMLKGGAQKFLVTGDVYRRDSIDATHFPVFHQMEVGAGYFNLAVRSKCACLSGRHMVSRRCGH